jgi:hypothetical protein
MNCALPAAHVDGELGRICAGVAGGSETRPYVRSYFVAGFAGAAKRTMLPPGSRTPISFMP